MAALRWSEMKGEDMVEIPAGRFRMGSADFYPEEGPVREVEVGGFAIDRGPVTVARFSRLSRKPVTSRSPSVRPIRLTIPTPTPCCWSPDRPSFIPRPGPCLLTTQPAGGLMFLAQAGATPRGPTATTPSAKITRSPM